MNLRLNFKKLFYFRIIYMFCGNQRIEIAYNVHFYDFQSNKYNKHENSLTLT